MVKGFSLIIKIYKQVLVLKWIQNNIESFGGDKNQVTLAGESAGANSVALHLISPLSCGLYQRAILQSSGATPRWGFMSATEAFNRSGIRNQWQIDFLHCQI